MLGVMSKAGSSKRFRLWVRFTLCAGIVVADLYFVFDFSTLNFYKLLITVGLLGSLLFFFNLITKSPMPVGMGLF